jgi:hypothetical protein
MRLESRIASRRPFVTAHPPCEAIDREQHNEREEEQDHADRRRLRIAKMIELSVARRQLTTAINNTTDS